MAESWFGMGLDLRRRTTFETDCRGQLKFRQPSPGVDDFSSVAHCVQDDDPLVPLIRARGYVSQCHPAVLLCAHLSACRVGRVKEIEIELRFWGHQFCIVTLAQAGRTDYRQVKANKERARRVLRDWCRGRFEQPGMVEHMITELRIRKENWLETKRQRRLQKDQARAAAQRRRQAANLDVDLDSVHVGEQSLLSNRPRRGEDPSWRILGSGQPGPDCRALSCVL
jgi:hypothetical protein